MRATLPALLDDLARRFGSREALVSARRRVTYDDLAREASTIAFGVWCCGGLLVPLSTLDRPRELAHALNHAEVTLLVRCADSFATTTGRRSRRSPRTRAQ